MKETNYKEIRNKEKNGIERYYDGIPTNEERNELKANGWKWNRQKGCWYTKVSDTKTAPIKEELKALRLITDFDEFMSIWSINHSYHYYGYAKKTADQLKELEIKDNKKDFSRYRIYETLDGFYLVFDTKPTIDNTLYYDDEYEAPDKDNLQVFINYNMSNFKYDLSNWQKEINDLHTIGCCCGNIETKPYIMYSYYKHDSKEVYPYFYNYWGNTRRNEEHFVRDLSEEEIKDYLTICEELKNDYIERLTKYFKKYNKNIRTYGYWANR